MSRWRCCWRWQQVGWPSSYGAVIAIAVALFGMAFGRLMARLFERPSGFYPVWFYFWVEAAGGALLLLAA